MSDKKRSCSNENGPNTFGNMTPDWQNMNEEYLHRGCRPPITTSEDLNWNQPQNSCLYNVHNIGRAATIEPFPHSTYSFLPSQHIYDESRFANYPTDYDVYKPIQNGASDFRILPPPTSSRADHMHDSNNVPSNPIIDLVGNWMTPNNSGTYSPFGNSDLIPNVFDIHEKDLKNQINDESSFVQPIEPPLEERSFQFNRDTKKPRMVAEVKPMRPSYSDVLTKAVPQTTSSKQLKAEMKDAKPKKDNKKNGNKDKLLKAQTITRSNTNNDIKDITIEKSFSKIDAKANGKVPKNGQLSRKWASLDNIADPFKSSSKVDEAKKKKADEGLSNKGFSKLSAKKMNKTMDDVDLECEEGSGDAIIISKNNLKKGGKANGRVKVNEAVGNNERAAGKRQRTRKRENSVRFGVLGQKLKLYTKGWWNLFAAFVLWLYNLISDICSLSLHISSDVGSNVWIWLSIHYLFTIETAAEFIKNNGTFSWMRDKIKGAPKSKPETKDESATFSHTGLPNNINMPTTGEEAMKRLLACKGKDPYSILGVTPTCTDDDIKRYYKKQAFLVHPDKNQQPGAEEAFKILVHAFDMIGEPTRRASYDRGVVESAQVVQAWSELNDLLQQLQQKVEAAANTIRCSACGLKHKRIKMDRPSYAARNCNSCKIHHAAREGDIWAEARVFGFLWHYYACMEGGVYDITEWAGCQKDSLKHLKPDSHHVQYRIALGRQNNQPRRHSASPRSEQPDLENLLHSLYGQKDGMQNTASRRKNKKTK